MPIPIPTTTVSSIPSSQWHCISPATRPLNLQVLEITSISLTIALSLARQPSNRASHQASGSNSNSTPSGSGSNAAKQRRPRHRVKTTQHESDEDLTAVEDNDGTGADNQPGHAGSSVSPYVSSSQSGPFPVRLAPLPDAKPSFKELLSKGVMVTVNGRPWNQIVAHVSDDEPSCGSTESNEMGGESEALSSRVVNKMVGQTTRDRAVVGIFGLEPGKEYEIDLKVVANFAGDGEPLQAVTANIVTPGALSTPTGTRSRANSLRNRGTRSRSSSLLQAAGSGDSPSPADQARGLLRNHSRDPLDAPVVMPTEGDEVDNGNASWGIAPSAEEIQASHLRHSIAVAHAERDDLAAQLKKSRRESQKVEAGLKSEVEALKRAMEKSTLPDQRSRQKSLALQEQVKQAFAAAEGAEQENQKITDSSSTWEDDEAGQKAEFDAVRSARDTAKVAKEEVLERDKKTMAELDNKLANVTARSEKHTAKKDKLSKENEQLKQKLEDIASARREVEKRNDAVRQQRMMVEDYAGPTNLASIRGPGLTGAERPLSGGWEFESGWTGGRGLAGRGAMGSNSNLVGLAQAAAGGNTVNLNYPDNYGQSRSRQGSVFNPRNLPAAAHARSATGPSPSSAAVALATQGIPRGATGGISHLGNPTGFFAGQSQPTEGSSTLAGRALRSPSARDGGGSVSPMMANVTAAPFMPQSQLAAIPATSPTTSHQDHHTSLVPPQLQHRIYLPRGRSGTSPGTASRLPVEDSSDSPMTLSAAAPAFPPLPSQNAVNPGIPAAKQGAQPGPSLASIVTRAIIPNYSPLLSQQQQQQQQQQQPSRQGSGERGLTGMTSPPVSRPTSWLPESAEAQTWSNHNSNTLSPATEEFPPLSPVQGSFAGRASPHPRLDTPISQNSWGRAAGSHTPSRRDSIREKDATESEETSG